MVEVDDEDKKNDAETDGTTSDADWDDLIDAPMQTDLKWFASVL